MIVSCGRCTLADCPVVKSEARKSRLYVEFFFCCLGFVLGDVMVSVTPFSGTVGFLQRSSSSVLRWWWGVGMRGKVMFQDADLGTINGRRQVTVLSQNLLFYTPACMYSSLL